MTETLEGTYVPGAMDWVREQVEVYEETGGQEANTLFDADDQANTDRVIPVLVATPA